MKIDLYFHLHRHTNELCNTFTLLHKNDTVHVMWCRCEFVYFYYNWRTKWWTAWLINVLTDQIRTRRKTKNEAIFVSLVLRRKKSVANDGCIILVGKTCSCLISCGTQTKLYVAPNFHPSCVHVNHTETLIDKDTEIEGIRPKCRYTYIMR